MNAEQLHSIASMIISDVDESQILTSFNELGNSLLELSSNPGNTEAQSNVARSRNQLFKRFDILMRNRWPAGVQQTVAELGGGVLIDGQIKDHIRSILQEEAITPSTAQRDINHLSVEIGMFIDRLRALKESFEALNIEEERLSAGEVELGILIPREQIENRLDQFGQEISKIDEILKLFSVVAIGSREEFEIRYVSSSDLKLFTKPNAKTAALVSAAVTCILTSLNEVADLKIKYDEIVQSGIEEKHLKGLKKGIQEKLQSDLEILRQELIEKFSCHTSEADRNEDTNRLTIAIDQLAPRLERGYSVEIRVGALPAPEENGEEEVEPEHDESMRNLLDELQDNAQELKRIAPIGTPVLGLEKPDSANEPGTDDNK